MPDKLSRTVTTPDHDIAWYALFHSYHTYMQIYLNDVYIIIHLIIFMMICMVLYIYVDIHVYAYICHGGMVVFFQLGNIVLRVVL